MMAENFSSGYTLIGDIDVIRWPDEEALINPQLLEGLRQRFGGPIVAMCGGRHYQFRPRDQIGHMTATVPKQDHHDEPSAFLLRDQT